MRPARTLAYLDALGLESWVPRQAPAAAPAAAGAPMGETPAAAGAWPDLRQRVAGCTRCPLCATRTQTVFGTGDTDAEWLVVGEAPGADEDRLGDPFVGRAGQLLNSMLHAIGFTRAEVYIANILKCRPPGNRDPAAAEVAQCLPYLREQIALVRPKLILVVGRVAAHNLLQTDQPLGRLRQQVHRYGEERIPVVVTYHPAYLLRDPAQKRKAWEDLRFAREAAGHV